MPADPTSPTLGKRQRGDNLPSAPHDDGFVADPDAQESGGDDDEDEEKPKSDKKAGRRKIKIEFIQDKSRRHITFSKRKAGIMKKAYELSTLTGTQVLLLVVSETGLVYTFTTAKLQPLVTQPEGKNLIQACLNAPHGTLPSSLPVGTPIGRSAMSMGHHAAPGSANVPGGLSIAGQAPAPGAAEDTEEAPAEEDTEHPPERRSKRRRASSSATNNTNNAPNASPRTAGSPTLPVVQPPQGAPGAQQQQPPPSPHRAMPPLPVNIPPAPAPGQPSPAPAGQPYPQYAHPGPQGDPAMYTGHPQGYPAPPYGFPPQTGHEGAAPWGAPPQVQGGHYGRR
ncbi:SRF-type transcription factor (DNA-binding and dimerization domain)-domain-containing protein [Sparassis latifolia]